MARPDTAQIVAEHTVPRAVVDALLAALRGAGARPQVVGRHGADQVVRLQPPVNPAEAAFLEARVGWDPRLRVDAGEQGAPDATYALVCLVETSRAHGLAALVLAGWGDHVDVVVSDASERAGYSGVHVGPRGVDKGTAVRRIAKDVGVARSDVIVFGDNANDLPLFAAAGTAYAVANATPVVRSSATSVIGSNVEDGVARTISRLVGWSWS